MSIHICLDNITAAAGYFPAVYSRISGTEKGILSNRSMEQCAVQLVDHSSVCHDCSNGIRFVFGKHSGRIECFSEVLNQLQGKGCSPNP